MLFPAPERVVYRSFSSSQPLSVISPSSSSAPLASIGMIAFVINCAANLGIVVDMKTLLTQCFGSSTVQGSRLFHGRCDDRRVVTLIRSRRVAGAVAAAIVSTCGTIVAPCRNSGSPFSSRYPDGLCGGRARTGTKQMRRTAASAASCAFGRRAFPCFGVSSIALIPASVLSRKYASLYAPPCR